MMISKGVLMRFLTLIVFVFVLFFFVIPSKSTAGKRDFGSHPLRRVN